MFFSLSFQGYIKTFPSRYCFNRLVYTFADPDLRDNTARMCELKNIQYVDLIGPMFQAMSIFFGREPLGKTNHRPNNRRALSDNYFRRIEAVEFTIKCDDGMAPNFLKEADVILLGVSRTGKTPLSVVLAQTMGLKVSNIPLVVDLPPPRQLFDPDIDPRRVFCLTLNIEDLVRIRRKRLRMELKNAEGRPRSNYADREYLRKDLQHAQKIASDNEYTMVDVTGRAVEETASWISSMLNERFPGSID
jgi:regulator of PEP synthase PpsR (kinase-PPPase family)